MELALPTALAALAVLIALMLRVRRRAASSSPPVAMRPVGPITVVVDLDAADGRDELVKRIVHDAAQRATAGQHGHEVVVLSRSGVELGRVVPGAVVRPVASAPASPYGRSTAPHRPSISNKPSATPKFDPSERPAVKRPIAEMFDIDDAVRASVRDPHDPVELVRAILAAGGTTAVRDAGLIRCGDIVVIVPVPKHDVHMHDALNEAYMSFRDSGAQRGVVVGVGMWDPLEVRRREILAPELRHVGPDAIQRMADAVALGADPLAFILAPAVVRGADGGIAGTRRAG